jgi:hypothetical protein
MKGYLGPVDVLIGGWMGSTRIQSQYLLLVINLTDWVGQ